MRDTRLTYSDVGVAVRLVARVLERREAPMAMAEELCVGLAAATGACWCSVGSRLVVPAGLNWGGQLIAWSDTEWMERYLTATVAAKSPGFKWPYQNELASRPDRCATVVKREQMSRFAPSDFRPYRDMLGDLGVGDGLSSRYRNPAFLNGPQGERVGWLTLHRERGERDFGERERAMVDLIHAELGSTLWSVLGDFEDFRRR